MSSLFLSRAALSIQIFFFLSGPTIGYISSTLHLYLMHWVTGYLAQSSNNCTAKGEGGAEEGGGGHSWWNLSSYHTNHYLSKPLLQSEGASIFWRGNQGRGRKAVQINSDKGLFSAAFIYDGMLLRRDPGQGLYQSSWYIFDRQGVFTLDEVLPLAKKKKKRKRKPNDVPIYMKEKSTKTRRNGEVLEQPQTKLREVMQLVMMSTMWTCFFH